MLQNEGYGLTAFPTTFGSKSIDNSKMSVVNVISGGFTELAGKLQSLKPVNGRHIEAQKAWAELTALAIRFESAYCGTPIVGNA